jgi:hypothetical protein
MGCDRKFHHHSLGCRSRAVVIAGTTTWAPMQRQASPNGRLQRRDPSTQRRIPTRDQASPTSATMGRYHPERSSNGRSDPETGLTTTCRHSAVRCVERPSLCLRSSEEVAILLHPRRWPRSAKAYGGRFEQTAIAVKGATEEHVSFGIME